MIICSFYVNPLLGEDSSKMEDSELTFSVDNTDNTTNFVPFTYSGDKVCSKY